MLEADEVPSGSPSPPRTSSIRCDAYRALTRYGLLPGDASFANAAAADSMSAAMAFHREAKLRIDNWPPSNDTILKEIIGLCNFWTSDPVGTLKQRRGLPFKPFLSLHRHAMFCGLWIHYVRASFHQSGTIFAMAWGATLLHRPPLPRDAARGTSGDDPLG